MPIWRTRRPNQLALDGPSVRFVHLLLLREDIRSEIKTRIQQRDGYSIQLILGLGVIFAAAFAQHGLDRLLIASPLVSIYFTMLILYSYRIHDVLARYLRTEIEPRLARLVIEAQGDSRKDVDWDQAIEWENWYVSHGRLRPGLRRTFFYWTSIVTTAGAMSYLWTQYSAEPGFVNALRVSTAAYVAALIALTVIFRHELASRRRRADREQPRS